MTDTSWQHVAGNNFPLWPFQKQNNPQTQQNHYHSETMQPCGWAQTMGNPAEGIRWQAFSTPPFVLLNSWRSAAQQAKKHWLHPLLSPCPSKILDPKVGGISMSTGMFCGQAINGSSNGFVKGTRGWAPWGWFAIITSIWFLLRKFIVLVVFTMEADDWVSTFGTVSSSIRS